MYITEKIHTMLNEWLPYKESLVYFETIARMQNRIWPDSADYGYTLDTEDMKVQARQNLKSLMDTYGYKMEKWEGGSSTSIFIPFEVDEGLLAGTVLTVTYNKVKNLEFLSVDFNRTVLSSDEARAQYNSKIG